MHSQFPKGTLSTQFWSVWLIVLILWTTEVLFFVFQKTYTLKGQKIYNYSNYHSITVLSTFDGWGGWALKVLKLMISQAYH